MPRLKISESKDYFVDEEGKKFFYLADTVWSAFTNISMEEWVEYLDYRKMQNFNALQINILPQWDASPSDINILPFKLKSDGSWDFYNINQTYFDRAEQMVRMAWERGFIPALVILWCNYVRDTWGSKINPQNIMPFDFVRPWVEYIGERFGKYDPIFIISGDTNFEGPQAIDYYLTALETIKDKCPHCLTTMHLSGGFWELPKEFEMSSKLDFYMFQSGHDVTRQNLAYILAEKFMAKTIKRPIVNGEPCYEGHSYGNNYGRFTRFDVRKAVWSSLLSGAKAGVTYGAHGIWSWYKKGKDFISKKFSGIPYDWKTALIFEGAWDISFTRWLFETFDLFDLSPAYKVLNETNDIRMAVSKDNKKIAIYIPYATEVSIDMDLSAYELVGVILDDRHVIKPESNIEGNKTMIYMYQFNSDVIVLGEKS